MLERNIQSKKMAACEKVATTIVHEFNNILATITYSAELAAYDIPENSPAHKDLKRVLQAGTEAGNFMRSIMSFCRPAKSGFSRFNLTEFLYKVIDTVTINFPENISFKINNTNTPLFINADVNQIQFIILEIIRNAEKSIQSEAGEISVLIEETDSPLDTPGKYARLSISDNGPGIPGQHIDEIFDPFFTTRKKEANGIGLSTVYSYVQNSGGSIHVMSIPEGMTVFDIYLPVDNK